MNSKLKIAIISLVGLIIIFVIYVAYQLYWKKSSNNFVDIAIKSGESVEEIVVDLKKSGVVSNAWLFKIYLKFSGQDKTIQSGLGRIASGSARNVAAALAGSRWNSTPYLFKEGWTVDDYDRVLFDGGIISERGLFAKLVGEPGVNYCLDTKKTKPRDFSAEYDFLKNKSACHGLEGYLFPDTYYLSKNISAEDATRIMLDNFDKKLTSDLRAQILRQGKTIEEIIIMASLIEAEARDERDRFIVSDILWRRLKVGMGLELDSTVNYITGAGKPAISLVEKETNSLYNTYKYRGLPPGPINNPGLEAIVAAIYPVPNDYWFFLTGRDGQMYYAKNLEEHNRLKYLYLK
ncbi:MAG: endolytic transglycosylase MltG [bacterium]|nr:endolytic transglycosylase MltG [bacterium]